MILSHSKRVLSVQKVLNVFHSQTRLSISTAARCMLEKGELSVFDIYSPVTMRALFTLFTGRAINNEEFDTHFTVLKSLRFVPQKTVDLLLNKFTPEYFQIYNERIR